MGAAIAGAVSGPWSLVLPVAVVMIVAFLGVFRLIAKGDVHKVSAVTLKNRLLGEITLTYRTEESAAKAEDEPGGGVDMAP
ncbi:hypothetical protein GCM10009525_41750 [Streptosporangium amethystogenes subsp. fukuiense]